VAPWTASHWSARGLVGTGGGLGDALFDRIRRHDRGFHYEDLEAAGDGSRPAQIHQRALELAQRYDRGYLIREVLEREFDLDSARSDVAVRDAALQVIKQEPGRYLAGTAAMFMQLVIGPGSDRSLTEYYQTRFEARQLEPFPSSIRNARRSSLPTTPADRATTERLVNLYRDSWLGLWLAPLLLFGSQRCLSRGSNGGLLLLPVVAMVLLLLYAALDGPLERHRMACAPLLTLLAVGGLTQLSLLVAAAGHRLRFVRTGTALEHGA
jgi:hypothetical protein